MKTYAVIMLIVLCPFLPVQANIFNGYLIEKQKLEKQIESCATSLEDADTEKSKRKIEKNLKRLQKDYKAVARKYAHTQQLINLVKLIDPALFKAVSTVANAKGTLTHVYVRCVSSLDEDFARYANFHFNAKAYTSVSQAKGKVHVCRSPYGVNTITITVAKCDTEILALAHEFAHVLYTVPNLKTYTEFITRITNNMNARQFGRGHHPGDPGRHHMLSTERKFKENYARHLKETENDEVL